MKAVIFDAPGDESVMRVDDAPDPVLESNEILIAVRATAVNRADLLQRRGLYPPPPGAPEILGLECAGVVLETGADVTRFREDDRVMALLSGGGYAEKVAVDERCVMRMPDAMSFEEAAAIPETFLTAYLNIFLLGGVDAGDAVLVHGGSGGVGTAAIALCRELGARIFVTAGSAERARRCIDLGATGAVDYSSEDFEERIRAATHGFGVDVIVDPIGAPYFEKNLSLLSIEGRLVLIGLMGGHSTGIDLALLLRKRIGVVGSTLRSRSNEEKGILIESFLDEIGDALDEGRLRAVVDRVLPIGDAAAAHRLMNEGGHFGKIVLDVTALAPGD